MNNQGKNKLKKIGLSTARYIKNYDLFGDPVQITYKGKDSHKTFLGGLITIIICSILFVYVGWRIYLFSYRERDEYWTSLTVSDWDNIGSY